MPEFSLLIVSFLQIILDGGSTLQVYKFEKYSGTDWDRSGIVEAVIHSLNDLNYILGYTR